MLGAIIGDIVGSPYEFNNIDTKDFPLFSSRSRFTDDTIHTVALADSIINNKDWRKTIQRYYDMYPNIGYGGMFIKWAKNKKKEPYNSWGNGAAMRVSPVAWLCDERDILLNAKRSAEITHNHTEGIAGAQYLAKAIYMARNGRTKKSIKEVIEYYYYIPTLKEIKILYKILLINNQSSLYSCQHSVPQAIRAFLNGNSFEDVLRIAVSMGGDSDTIACMAGSIAEAYYGIPKNIEKKAMTYLNKHLLKIVKQFKKEIS